MDDKAVKAIESVLAKGDSVEIKPGPNGTVKILRVKKTIISQKD